MKSYALRIRLQWLPAVICVMMAWSGCSSVSLPNLKDRNYRERQVYTHQAGEVFSVTRDVIVAMGFTIESANESKGAITAASRVLPGSAAQLSRQRRAVASIHWNSDAMSEVRIGFWESTEEPARNENAVSSERLIRGGPLYEAFWLRMEQALPAELPPAQSGESGKGTVTS